MSPVFGRESSYVFKIFSNEEERMHIHVLVDGHEAMQNDSRNNISNTSVSVLMINAQGIMISVGGQDYFLSYNRVPWMREASINDVLNVQMCGAEAVEWPALDVDLELDSLRHPERYPLLIKRNPTEFLEA